MLTKFTYIVPGCRDPALMRSGRLDRKIELPHPDEESRVHILKIHARDMNVNLDGELDSYVCRANIT